MHPRPRRRPARLLAMAVAVLLLAVLAFAATAIGMSGHATPAPTVPTTSPAPAAPTLGILDPDTTAADPTLGYDPAVAGPPATDLQGRWIPGPDATSTSSSAQGGGR